QTPDRFEKVVCYLPAALDEVRSPAVASRMRALLAAIESDDTASAAALLSADIPVAMRDRPAAWRYVRERLDALLRDGLTPAVVDLAQQCVLPDRSVLAAVNAPVLVIGCRGDALHPPAVAEQLAQVLPN